MKKIINLLGLSLVSIFGVAHASETVGEVKSTATMQATCSISANQIGFGAVAAPLLAQSAQSEMSVKCSNASPYTIELAYGGIYGTGTYSDYTIEYSTVSTVEKWVYYNLYDKNGNSLEKMICSYAAQSKGKVNFNTVAGAQAYGYAKAGTWYDGVNACVTNGTLAGTTPKGWVGAYNAAGQQGVGGAGGYSYGVMNGISKGDKLAYSIAVPGDVNKVWNVGTNSYKSTGNGDTQTIPLNAKIVPDKSTSKYLAPDMYLDTVTAVISY